MNHQLEKPFIKSPLFKYLVWFSIITFICIQIEQQTHDTKRTTTTNHR
jgi:hypothetical protein